MTVGTLHEIVGCTASFTRFVPFSCYRPGPESVLSAPAAVACSCLHLDRYGSCRSARIRVGPRVSCRILPSRFRCGRRALPERVTATRPRLTGCRHPVRRYGSLSLAGCRGCGRVARSPGSISSGGCLVPRPAAARPRPTISSGRLGWRPVTGRDLSGRLSVDASPCRWSDAVLTTGPPPRDPLGSPLGLACLWRPFGPDLLQCLVS